MIKLTGGRFKRKQLDTISKFVRPTSSLKREAFFSVIESYAMKYSYDFFNNKIFLDLYAGIGTMGLEAISRGIKSVMLINSKIPLISVNNNTIYIPLPKRLQNILSKENVDFTIKTFSEYIAIILNSLMHGKK